MVKLRVRFLDFKYYRSNFNTNETLTEFLWSSKDRNQKTPIHVSWVWIQLYARCSAYIVQSVGKSAALVPSGVLGLTAGLQCQSNSQRVDETFDPRPNGEVTACDRWGQSRSWLGTKVFLSLESACTASEAANYCNVFTNDDGLNKDFFFVASSGGS